MPGSSATAAAPAAGPPRVRRDRVCLRVLHRLVVAHFAAVDHLVEPGVIFGQLPDPCAVNPIGPAVAEPADGHLAAVSYGGDDGRFRRISRMRRDGGQRPDRPVRARIARRRADRPECIPVGSALADAVAGVVELKPGPNSVVAQSVFVTRASRPCEPCEGVSPVGSALADAVAGVMRSKPGSDSAVPENASAKADPTGCRFLVPRGVPKLFGRR